MRASLTYDRLFVIGSVDGIPLPSSFNLDMIEFLLSPLSFFIMRMFADLVLTLRQPPCEEPLLLLYKNVLYAFSLAHQFLSLFFLSSFGDTEMAEKMVRVETFWRVAWTVFP